MAIASFGPTATTTLFAGSTSANIVLPTTGTPTIAVVTNTGEYWAYVALGSNTVTASEKGSMAIAPRSSVALTIGAATYIAGIALGGGVLLNVTVGN